MRRWLSAIPLAAALIAVASEVRADPPEAAARAYADLVASPGVCSPGAKMACRCPNGTWSQQVCEPSGLRFSVCACASVSVTVPQLPTMPNVDVSIPRPRPRPRTRSSGQGMLIGGGVSLLVGTGHLVWGLERLRETRADPLGIVMIATGGVAMAVGVPLTIVGIVFLATRGRNPKPSATPWTLAPTASGFALQF